MKDCPQSIASFGFTCGDCRAIFEPIDYLVFTGLCKGANVESLLFVDVKSGLVRQ
jgi:predicted Holliday junction resolvase-like endonuclease